MQKINQKIQKLIIHTRIGKYARFGNLRRKKKAAIKLNGKLIGQFVVVIGRGYYRSLINENSKLKRQIIRIRKSAGGK